MTNKAEMVRLTEEALRGLNSPFALARCGLLDRLPRTLAATMATCAIRHSAATPLLLAQALNQVLVQAVERLKPVDGRSVGQQALPYRILRERYLEGQNPRQIATRHSISERTVYRYRGQGVEVIARELQEQEALLARGGPNDAG